MKPVRAQNVDDLALIAEAARGILAAAYEELARRPGRNRGGETLEAS